MGALTPARSVAAVLRYLPGDRPFGSYAEQVSLIHALGLPTIPSPTTCTGSASPRHVTCRRVEPRSHPHGAPPTGTRGFAIHSLARHLVPAESSSASSPAGEASYGLVVHLLLLPTPSHDDAVAVAYRFTLNLERTFTSPTKCALRRTRAQERLRRGQALQDDHRSAASGAKALLMTEQSFRKIMGCRDLWTLNAALGRNQQSIEGKVA